MAGPTNPQREGLQDTEVRALRGEPGPCSVDKTDDPVYRASPLMWLATGHFLKVRGRIHQQ